MNLHITLTGLETHYPLRLASTMPPPNKDKYRGESDYYDAESNQIVNDSMALQTRSHSSVATFNAGPARKDRRILILKYRPNSRALTSDKAIKHIIDGIAKLQISPNNSSAQSKVAGPASGANTTHHLNNERRTALTFPQYWDFAFAIHRPSRLPETFTFVRPLQPPFFVTNAAAVADSVESTTSRAHLLGLPPELRNKIYTMLYDPQAWNEAAKTQLAKIITYVERRNGQRVLEKTWRSKESGHSPSQDPIRVCRQVYWEMKRMYQEVRSAYWNCNTFVIAFRLEERGSRGLLQHCKQSSTAVAASEELAHLYRLLMIFKRIVSSST